jgi:hypothetical protein
MASIVMLAISGATQSVQAQILSSDLHGPGQSLLTILAEDGSGSISNTDFQIILDGEVAALNAFYAAGPNQQALFNQGFAFALIEFSDSAVQVGGIFTVTDQASLTALTDAISGKTKSNGFTCITCVIELADIIAGNAGLDVVILDIVTDGVPEGSTQDPNADTEAKALAARDLAVVPNGGNIDGINGLGISLDQSGEDFLVSLVWPQPGVLGLSTTNGFVLTVPNVASFAPAFQSKLGLELCDILPELEVCQPPPVGGEFLPVDGTALLIAGMSANMSLIAPIVLGIAGASAYIIRSRMNKE